MSEFFVAVSDGDAFIHRENSADSDDKNVIYAG